MASNNNIDVMGILNSITSSQTLARAEQIEITRLDGSQCKIPSELCNNVRMMTSTELVTFMAEALEGLHPEDRIFICSTSEHSEYDAGHFYLYNGITNNLDDITPAMGGGEGGGGSGNVKLSVPFTTKEMDANKEFTINFTWSSRNTGRGQVICTIDNLTDKTIMMVPGSSSWTIKGLTRGTHVLRIIAVDSSQMQSSPWTFEIKVGSLSIESSFSQNKIFNVSSPIDIGYKYFTNEPTKQAQLIFTIDEEEGIEETGKPDALQYKSFDGLSAGEHTITLKIRQFNLDENEEQIDVKESNVLSYTIVVAEAGVLYLTLTGNPTISVTERDRVTLPAKVTYIGATQFAASLHVFKHEGGGWVEDTSYVYGVDTTWDLGVNQYITTFQKEGSYRCDITVSISAGSTTQSKTVSYIVTVARSSLYTIDPIVDTSLLLHLSASGKTNNDVDRTEWRDTAIDEIRAKIPGARLDNRTPINVELNNFNWGTNGWFKDTKGHSYLNLNSGAYAVVDLQPFADEIGTLRAGSNQRVGGLTFDIEFETEDVLYNTAKVVSCYDGDVGFWIDTEYATLLNNNSEKEIKVTEKDEEDTTEILAWEPKLDGNGEHIYKDAITGAETSSPTTMVNGVETQNQYATVPVYAHYIRYTQVGPFQTNFPSNTKTRITFVIQRGEENGDTGAVEYGDYQFPCMCIYVNGVLTSVEKISNSTSFYQSIPRKIYLGCDSDLTNTGKAYIYNLRLYNRALSMTEVLTNYVADFEDAQEQNDMIERNALGDAQESNSLPIMEFYVVEDEWNRMSKDQKIFGRMQYVDSNNLAKQIYGVNMRCQWQGTSTLAYAVKNLKIRLYDSLKYNKTGDALKGDRKYKYDLGNGIPEYIFTLKADYMDSMHGRNTAIANFVSNLRNGAADEVELTPPQEYKPACRTSIYGFPVQLYVTKYRKRTFDGENLVFDPEDLISRELYGVYNFNLDKNSTDSLGIETKNDFLEDLRSAAEIGEMRAAACEENYPKWDCMSFEGSANSDIGAGAFNSIDDVKIHSEFELRFEDEGDIIDDGEKSSTGSIMVLNSSGNYINNMTGIALREGMSVRISGINSDINGDYTIARPNKLVGPKYDIVKDTDDILTNLDGNYTVDYGFTYNGVNVPVYINVGMLMPSKELTISSVESAESRIARRYIHLKKFIKWVYETPEEEFKRDLHKHVDVNAVLDYYTTVLVLLLADNFGKNVMWDTWGPISENRKKGNNKYVYTPEELREYDDYIWYPHFYDCDTCLGLDNSGNMRFDVSDGLEYNEVTGKDDIAQGVFNTSKSKFWVKFRNAFADEIKGRYSALRSYDNTSDVSTRRSTYTYESFNEYFYDNQISKISEAAYNKDFKEKYLKHDDYLFMMHGRQYEFFQRFIKQRLYFLDTFFGLGDSETKATIRVEYNDFATVPVVFDIKTYQPSYVTVKFTAASNEIRKKVPRNTTVRFEGWVNTATDQEVLIFNAPNIKSFGDVSRYSPKTVDVSQMTKLTEISVGTKEWSNYNLTSLALGSNQYLTKVVAENCGAMNTALDVSGCTNLKYISTEGSTIPNVEFNVNGGSLEEAHFSYNTRSVSLHNFNLLKTITFEEIDGVPFMNNISQLEIVDCPLLLGYIDPETHLTVDGYLAGNILDKWVPINKNIRINLPGLYGKMGDYQFLDACATLHELYDLTGKNIILTGKIDYMGEAIPTKYSTYKEYFPNLHITYENVTNFSGMFKNYKNINSIITREYIIEDPITHNITRQNRKYWLDPKYEKYPDYLTNTANFDKIGNEYYRKLTCYDEDDQELLAWEIKDRLSPFAHASDFSEMFMGDSIIEKIYDDTFDNFDFSDDIITLSMFEGCTNLKYIEVPRIKNIGSYMFKDCPNTVVYLPREVEDISDYAFQNMSASGGQHHLVLFEGDRPSLPVDNIKDARFNIKKYGTGVNDSNGNEIMRALKTEYIKCWDLIPDGGDTYHNEGKWLKISYFLNATDKKLVYNVENLDQISMDVIKTPISFNTWNIDLVYSDALNDYTNEKNTFGNPLDLDEMLYGSMKNFDHTAMHEMTIPTFNVAYTSSSEPAYSPEELSFIKLFIPVINDISVASTVEMDQVNLLMDTHTFIPKYMFKDTHVARVVCQDQLRSIGAFAFETSTLESFEIENWAFTARLLSIGDNAFAGTMIQNIIIPDTVTMIGEGAFRDNKNIQSIRYSSAMRTVPINCFSNCNDIQHPVYSITGFSPDIESFEDFAFDKSTGLMLVTHDPESEDPLECHWAAPTPGTGDSTLYKTLENSYVFLNYFRNLKRIGKYALRGIGGIRTIKINSLMGLIGAGSLIPPETELTGESMPQTKLIWELGPNVSYGNLAIQEQAFLGRDFIWHSNIGGFDGDISHAIFVPSTLGSLESYVFSPTGGGLSGGSNAKLEYVLSDALSLEAIGLKWSPYFATSPSLRESVYNYKTTYIGQSAYAREFTRRASVNVIPADNATYDSNSGEASGTTPRITYGFNNSSPSTSGAHSGDIYINICDETGSTAGRWYVYRYDGVWSQFGYANKPVGEIGTEPTVNSTSAEFVYDDTTGTIKVSVEIKYNLHYSVDNALYFLMKNNTAIYAKLLEVSASVLIPDIVTFESENYAVKKIANSAFIDNGSALNSIIFATGSTVTSIGGNLFSTTQINRIEVADTDLTVPTSLVSIGSGTPFKDTMWFAGQTVSDFVYLNDVCLGYSSGEQNIELENNQNATMRTGTKIIYDNAFKGRRSLTTIALPTTLERIETSAFEDCNALRSIDFHPCANKLNYIGDSAFKNCLALTEMTYTKRITHVGKNAMSGNAAITKYVFEKDCTLDSTSDPMYLSYDPETGLNVSITDLRISSSMGSFFAPGAPGEIIMSKLSQLKTLILGEYTPIDVSSTQTMIDDEPCYVVDLSTIWPSATQTTNGVTSPVVLTVNTIDLPNGIFYKASGDYESAINIGGIARNTLKPINVIQTVMGLNPNLGRPVTVIAKSDVTGILSSSQFKNVLANRVTTVQVQ